MSNKVMSSEDWLTAILTVCFIVVLPLILLAAQGWFNWQQNEVIKHCVDAGKMWTGSKCE